MENTEKNKEILEELEALSPGLHKLLHQNRSEDLPFRYFNRLPDQVLEKIHAQKSKGSLLDGIVARWPVRKQWVLALASSVAVILISILIIFRSTRDTAPALDFVNIPVDEIQSYLLSHAGDLDEAQLNLLHQSNEKMELYNVTEDDLQPVIEDYLYQVSDNDFN